MEIYQPFPVFWQLTTENGLIGSNLIDLTGNTTRCELFDTFGVNVDSFLFDQSSATLMIW